MALYRLPQDGRESPASRQDAAQLRMIEPEQLALAPYPLLRCRLGVDLLVVAHEGGRERQLAEIVQGGGRDRRICLHGGHQLADIAAVAGDRMQSPARLPERRQPIDNLECRSRTGIDDDTRLPTFGYHGSRPRPQTRSPGSGGRCGNQGLHLFAALLEWPCFEPAASFLLGKLWRPDWELASRLSRQFRATAPA